MNGERTETAAALGAAEHGELTRLRTRVLELENTVDQLQTALGSRILIEQAKGMLAERLGVSVDDAFTVLRTSARSARINIHLLAAAVVGADGATPDLILARIRDLEPSRGAPAR